MLKDTHVHTRTQGDTNASKNTVTKFLFMGFQKKKIMIIIIIIIIMIIIISDLPILFFGMLP